MTNRDNEGQLGFGDAFNKRESNTYDANDEERSNDEFIEEAFSANYPEDTEDFSLEWEREAELDEDEQGEDSEADVELIWGDEPTENNPDTDEVDLTTEESNPFDSEAGSLPPLTESADLDSEPNWTDDPVEAEKWLAEEALDSEEESSTDWPIGLIAVAVVALLLLAAGGYGIMQQRAAAEDELRELRAALANTISRDEASENRQALRATELENTSLADSLATLQLENRQLQDTVAGLEAQLEVQREAAEVAAAEAASAAAAAARSASRPAAKPAPVTTPDPVPVSAAIDTAAPASGWFVNFSSYSQRATAESWRARLAPGAGEVMIVPAEVGGRTVYRLRVVGLGSREEAEQVARGLEQAHGVSKLWVGEQ
ncbi:MAG: SPOR domain-containing protein [Pseudomonadota bacterium]